MPIRKLGHYSVRTSRLDESRHFYVDVLGLRVGYRPPLDFPGYWLYDASANDHDYGVVHLIGTGGEGQGLIDYLGERQLSEQEGTGALDHLAFLATDIAEFRRRLSRHDIRHLERTVPSVGLRQIFLTDPSGLTIEMNFPALEAQELLSDPEMASPPLLGLCQ